MRNLGDIDKQSIAGAISTGTHGTGATLGGLATQVVGARLVTATGDVVETSPTQQPGAVRAGPARPGQRRRARRRDARGGAGLPPGGPRGAVAARGGPRAARRPGRPGRGQRPLRVLLVPAHAPGADQAQQPRAPTTSWSPCRGCAAWVDDELLSNAVFSLANGVATLAPSTTASINGFAARALSLAPLHRTVGRGLRLPPPGEVPRDGVRGPARPSWSRCCSEIDALDRVERRARAVPRRGAVRGGGRPVALDGARPRDRVRRRAPVPAAAVRAVLRGRRADRRRRSAAGRTGARCTGSRPSSWVRCTPASPTPSACAPRPTPTASSATRTWTGCWGPSHRLAA